MTGKLLKRCTGLSLASGVLLLAAGLFPARGLAAGLVVTSFSPSAAAPGSVVAISGSGFTGTDLVAFHGGVKAPKFSVVSDSLLEAVVPSGASSGWFWVQTGSGSTHSPYPLDIVQSSSIIPATSTQTSTTSASATSSSGTSSTTSAPQISGIAPATAAIGSVVSIVGSGFSGTQLVAFHGGVQASQVSVVSDTQIQAVVPPGAVTGWVWVQTSNGSAHSPYPLTISGQVSVKDTNAPDGSSTNTSTADPSTSIQITSVNPSSGPVGTSVEIYGSGFSGTTSVKFNGTSVSFTVDSDSQISTSVPANATSGPLSVTSPNGTATADFTVGTSDPTGSSRGYVTTPGELAVIAQKAAKGIQPYHDAELAVEHFANTGSSSVSSSTADPSYWPYGSISGPQSCGGTLQPSFLGNGDPLIEAKAITYGLLLPTDPSLANQYAADIRTHLLQLASTTSYGGSTYGGGNQCILNLSWYVPGWIIAADMIEGYSGWTSADKAKFQDWLAKVVYSKVDWASDVRENNWGAAGSATSGMIADYLTGSGILMVDRNGASINSHDAYAQAKQRELDRIDGNSYMDNYNCHDTQAGIRTDGGIPEELARGSTGCNGLWIASLDSSWMYTMTQLQGEIMMADMLWRRGDTSLFRNASPTGTGSIEKAVMFLLHNPNDASKSVPWKMTNDGPSMEILYRYYRNSYMAQQLGIGTSNRYIGGKSGQMLHFGTIFAGFAPSENPGPPPTVPAP